MNQFVSREWRALGCSFETRHLIQCSARLAFLLSRRMLQPVVCVLEVRVQQCVPDRSAAAPGDRACCDKLQRAVIAAHSSGIALVCRHPALLQPWSQSLARSWPASRWSRLQLCPRRPTRAVQAGWLLLMAVQRKSLPQLVTAEPFGLHAAAQAAAALCRAQCTHARHQ